MLFLGSDALAERLRVLNLELVSERAEVVLLCRDLQLSHDRLQRAITAVHRGGTLVAANPDGSHPSHGGEPQMETGAILAAIRTAVPRAVTTIVGKPAPDLFRAAIGRVAPGEAVAVGDNPETDVAGARIAGIDCILVGRHPDAIAANLAALV